MTKETIGQCTRCNKSIWAVETIHVAGKGQFCYACFNDDTAKAGDLPFDNAEMPPVTLHDIERRPHTFHIRSMLVPTGHEMEAIELQGGEQRGYHFRILGDFSDDAMALFGKLYERMRAALGRKHVKRGEFGWQIRDQHLTARIEANLEDDERLPLLVIDGTEFTWSQVGRMLKSFEGFTVDMTIRDTIEVVGGPLLEGSKPKRRRR
jgi:hypothetical protein